MIFGNATSPGSDAAKDIGTIKKLGFDFVELTFADAAAHPLLIKKNLARIKASLGKNKIPAIAAHAPYYADIGSVHEAIRLGWINEIKQVVDICEPLGVRKIGVHGFVTGVHRKHGAGELADLGHVDALQKSFSELVRYAKEKEMIVVYENTWESAEQFVEILKSVPGLFAAIDIGHAFHEKTEDAIKFIRKARPIGHMHVHDIGHMENHISVRDHIPIGEGELDFALIFEALKKAGYDDTMTLEVFTESRRGVKESLAAARKMWGK